MIDGRGPTNNGESLLGSPSRSGKIGEGAGSGDAAGVAAGGGAVVGSATVAAVTAGLGVRRRRGAMGVGVAEGCISAVGFVAAEVVGLGAAATTGFAGVGVDFTTGAGKALGCAATEGADAGLGPMGTADVGETAAGPAATGEAGAGGAAATGASGLAPPTSNTTPGAPVVSEGPAAVVATPHARTPAAS